MAGQTVQGSLHWNTASGLAAGRASAPRAGRRRGLLLAFTSFTTAFVLGAAGAALADSLFLTPAAPAPAAPVVPAVELPPALPFVDGRSFAAEAADERAILALPVEIHPLTLPENSNVAPDFLALRDELAAEIARYRQQLGGIEVAVAVTDLQTGETVSVNGDVAQRSGCTIMAYGLLAAVAEFQGGRADPADVTTAIREGIGSSSPPNVYWFLEQVFGDQRRGVAEAQAQMRAWGLQRSLFDHVPYYGDGVRDNLLTAREMNWTLTRLYRGELFTPEWTAYTLERLREIKPTLNYILPGQLPAAATMAHKIGYLHDSDGHINNDAGIVTFRGGDGTEKAYVITYLSQRAPDEPAGYTFGAALSRQVWDYFAAKYGAA